jgi:hypothetical protein
VNFDRRLARVEKIFGEAGACPLCKGEGGGPRIMRYRWDEPRPVVPGCPDCGKGHGGEVRFIMLDDRAIPTPLELP